MNRRWFQFATAVLWLALPLTALRYGLVWHQLPARMATHFAASGEPNGWMPRQVSLYFALGVTAFTLIFTAIPYAAQKQNHAQPFAAAWLAFSYLATGAIFYINSSVVQHNLTGQPVSITPMLLGLTLAVVVFIGLYLRLRGKPLPPAAPLAEEVHGSYLWALMFGGFTVLYFSLMASVSAFGVRAVLFLMGILFLLITAHAWSGFRYHFSPAVLEISTLGFRLRSIPCAEIRGYRIERWNPLRGYGIRGIGRTRAYVWSNQVVRVTTDKGEVFLGHNDPARIVRDLDMLRQYAQEP
jgi:hypothetical protein